MTDAEFLHGVENWSNHRFLLLEALKLTDGDVVEMGMGHGSTPFLYQWCKDAGRKLFSYENSLDWFEKCEKFNPENSFHVTDWDVVAERHLTPSVLFIDHAPGSRRKIDLVNFALRARIIVIHDSEKTGAGDYQVREHFSKFKWVKDHESVGAWASMLSNFIQF